LRDPLPLVERAQAGDEGAREELLRRYAPFAMRVASEVCGRYVELGRDDEASVALIALHEAVSSFRAERSPSFFSFAELVVRRRILDFQRREHRPETPFSSLVPEGEEGDPPLLEIREPREGHTLVEEALDRLEEIGRFRAALEALGIRLEELPALSPRHRDARENCLRVARRIAARPELLRQVRERGTLPLSLLEGEEGLPLGRKAMERQRKYILALVVVLSGEFPLLRSYLGGER